MKDDFAQKKEPVVISELPDPFMKADGTRVKSREEWPKQREYLKEMLAHYLYGHMPLDSGVTTGEVIFSRPVYNGRALAETIRITTGRNGEVVFLANLIRPLKEGKVPVITWNQARGGYGSPAEEEIVCERGYAIMDFDKEQIASDSDEAIHGMAAKAFPECDWGAIAIWAWGQSRLVDYLYSTEWADTEKIIATGHSRDGKVALCAGIYDERFTVCAPNGSGCGGGGCFRFLGCRYGEGIGMCETAGSIREAFPYWWCDSFGELEANQLPFDMHFAKALIAPRAMMTTDGLGDTWSNPFGVQVTWRAAQEVFEFLGVPGKNAMHFREGNHDFQAIDWLAIVDFCDEIFYGKVSKNNLVCFRPANKDEKPSNTLVELMDWRRIKLHYSWTRPE